MSNIVLFSASAAVILLYRVLCCRGRWLKKRSAGLMPLSLLTFWLLTFIFKFSIDPFKTPSYLGHQLREIFGTDLSVTMMISVGILIFLEDKFDRGTEPDVSIDEDVRSLGIRFMNLWALCALLPAVYLIWKVVNLNIAGEISALGKTADWTVMDIFAWHFFEHTLDYIYVASLVYSIYLLRLKAEYRNTAIEE